MSTENPTENQGCLCNWKDENTVCDDCQGVSDGPDCSEDDYDPEFEVSTPHLTYHIRHGIAVITHLSSNIDGVYVPTAWEN